MNKAWLKAPPAWKRGPLLTEDGNTVAHIYWRNGAIVDSKGNSWSMSGTVPQIAGSGATPPSAGSYTSAQRYTMGAGSEVLDIAGVFSVVAVYTNPPASAGCLLSDGTGDASDGWGIQATSTNASFKAGGVFATPASSGAVAGVNIVCGGWSGTAPVAKMNLGTYTTGSAGTYAVSATYPAIIGTYGGNANWFNQGSIYELLVTTNAPSDAAFIAYAQAIKRACRTGW